MNRDTVRTVTAIEPLEALAVAQHRRLGGWRLVQMHGTRVDGATEVNYAYALDGALEILRARVPDGTAIPSITGIYFAAFHYENELQDLFGLKVTDLAVDYKGHFYKLKQTTPYRPDLGVEGIGSVEAPRVPMAEDAEPAATPRDAHGRPVPARIAEGITGNRTIVPFGPQHPVLPEPIHLDLVLEDEKVVEAIPSIGFIHRGLEKLVEKRDFVDYVYVAERICGICSFMHGMGYCLAVENTMGIEVPKRADYLRTVLAEMARIHNHTMWLGLVADAFGFESLFMHSWRVREIILDVFEEITGGRVIFSICRIGGLRRDVDERQIDLLMKALDRIEKELEPLVSAFTQEYSVVHRMTGVGVLSKAEAYELGALGPMLRASGWALDTRLLGYAAYDDLRFAPVVETAGDCMARTKVRIRETAQSIGLIRQAVAKLPPGEIAAPVKGTPNGEFMARVEQPRGEAIYYVRGNGTRFLERFRVRTPTFANVPALVKTLQGCQLADVPMLVLTIDPCISCTER